MKIQVKIMAIFILFFAFAIIACTPGRWGTDKTSTNTVMYNGNTNTDGTVPIDTNTYLPTFTVTVLGNGTITKTGYTFAGWNTQADGNGTDRAPASTFAMGSSDVILYAKWTALPTYTVTYDANGGSGGLPADSNNYLAGATVTVLGSDTLTYPGYTFVSWNTQADGSGTALAPAATFAIGSSNAVLYARWALITCPVNMTYVILLGECVCNHFYVYYAIKGVTPPTYACQLCPTGWTYLGEYRSVGDYWSGMCTCTKTKTNNCNQ